MTEQSLDKGKELYNIIKTLKDSVVKIDTMTGGSNESVITISIVKDARVINVIRKALITCIEEKQEEFNEL